MLYKKKYGRNLLKNNNKKNKTLSFVTYEKHWFY